MLEPKKLQKNIRSNSGFLWNPFLFPSLEMSWNQHLIFATALLKTRRFQK